jgi:tRNA A37 threonylcarbamoyltransferase TsaD
VNRHADQHISSKALCRWQVGVQKARELSAHHQLPIVAVHHMEAHALMARAAAACCSSGSESEDARPAFPFLALLVSGGHNLLLVVRGVGDYQILGSTVDDAVGGSQTLLSAQQVPGVASCRTLMKLHYLGVSCTAIFGECHLSTNHSTNRDGAGEAFDKSARLLGLDASGAALEQLAREGDPAAIPFAVCV